MKWYILTAKGEFVEATCAWGDTGEDKEAALERHFGTYVGRKVGGKNGVIYYLIMTGDTVAVDVPDGATVKEVMAGP